ncbi:MAG TPA: hypothetical protein VHQ01_01310 [Pyrinomonadaceae bacterium]|jgi:hypothetical protein|nr:hypothetical protein [Pyrinomonadaceae bacterium]
MATPDLFKVPNTNPNPSGQISPAPQFRNAARSVEIEAQDHRDKQAYRYKFIFPQSVAVPNNGQRAFQIVVDADADFYAERLTGSALGPTDASGVRLLTMPTQFPLVGASGVGYADRGLMVSIKDGGSRIDLTDGFVPLELIFTPGYDIGTFYIPFPFKYYVRRNSKIVFTFINRDKAVDPSQTPQILYHFVSASLDGNKYLVKTK